MARRTLRSARQSTLRLPPLLDRLIDAEARDGQHDSASALRTFGELALVTIPTRGVFAPGEEAELYRAIEEVAREHLGLNKVRDEIQRALEAVAIFDQRDAIEGAYNAFSDVSERAYFFAGLAFGVTMASLGDSTWR
jgi:hypothetical protein